MTILNPTINPTITRNTGAMADTFTTFLNLIKPDTVKNALISDINGNMDLVDAAIQSLDDRLDVLDTDAPVVSTTVLSGPTANFQIVEQAFYKLGKFVFGNFRIRRITSALASNSDGNIVNTNIATAAVGWRPPNEVACPPTGAYGMAIPGTYINSAGVLAVGALIPNVSWGINDECQFSCFYIQSA